VRDIEHIIRVKYVSTASISHSPNSVIEETASGIQNDVGTLTIYSSDIYTHNRRRLVGKITIFKLVCSYHLVV